MNKKIGIIILSIVVVVAGIFLVSVFTAKKNDGFIDASEIPTVPKKYQSNEYYKLNISQQELCTIYLNDYISLMSTKPMEAYNMLDNEYKRAKYPTYDDFINYINTFYKTVSTIDRYIIKDNKYYVYDKNNNLFIFVTNGVMNYKVYLDDDTVAITNYDK